MEIYNVLTHCAACIFFLDGGNIGGPLAPFLFMVIFMTASTGGVAFIVFIKKEIEDESP